MAFGALSSGISSLKSFSKGMEVIGNNIANVNTTSYKSSSIKYSETFNQVLRQSAPSSGEGSNVQASQVGLGVQVEGISGNFEQGGLSATGQPTDLAISGEGFFKVVDPNANQEFATRGGDFRIDDRGFLVTSGGLNVQGFSGGSIGYEVDVDESGNWTYSKNLNTISGTIAPDMETVNHIQLDFNKGDAGVVDANSTNRNAIEFTNNLISRQADGETPDLGDWDAAITAFDAGNDLDVDAAYGHRVGGLVFGDDGTGDTQVTGVTGWHAFVQETVENLKDLRDQSEEGSISGIVTDSQIEIAVSSDFYYTMVQGVTGATDATGELVDSNLDGNAIKKLFLGANGATIQDASESSLTWDSTKDPFAEIEAAISLMPTEFSEAESVIKSERANQAPDLARFAVDTEGTITYFLDNGDSFVRGQVGIIDFNDKTALIREGSNLYSGFDAAGVKNSETNEGLQTASSGSLGTIQQGALELSNVDLTSEFASMITTQRGFQAGSRIITVADDILQEVVNLKR
ncbi:flagellar hook-basal body complex protein [Puniceicoccaceae bacterium K14]|nr:flagellar hook-basal body complex protein [Puniceicoccaceae bacterium K14]